MDWMLMEWHLKGTCNWIGSVFCVICNVVLVTLLCQRRHLLSTAAFYSITIGICGICMVIMEQTTFIREAVNPRFAPYWLFRLRQFTLTGYRTFLKKSSLPDSWIWLWFAIAWPCTSSSAGLKRRTWLQGEITPQGMSLKIGKNKCFTFAKLNDIVYCNLIFPKKILHQSV